MLAWNDKEAAKYIELFKAHETKASNILKPRLPRKNDQTSLAVEFLTKIPMVNSTDAMVLLERFGSIRNIVDASEKDLTRLPGIGGKKAKQIIDTFNCPL